MIRMTVTHAEELT